MNTIANQTLITFEETQEYFTHSVEIKKYESVALATVYLSSTIYSDLLDSLPPLAFDEERNAIRKFVETIFFLFKRPWFLLCTNHHHYYLKLKSYGITVQDDDNNEWFKTVIIDLELIKPYTLDKVIRLASKSFSENYRRSSIPELEYTYVGGVFNQGQAFCSDNSCPCPNIMLSKDEGYFYIKKTPFGSFTGNLTCEQGARLRKLDLKIAHKDAVTWWNSGNIPNRETPQNFENQIAPIRQSMSEYSQKMVNDQFKKFKVEVINNILKVYNQKPIYLFIDVETSGLPKNMNSQVSQFNLKDWPHIVQIAWIEYFEDGKINEQKEFIIKPKDFFIESAATKIHGITDRYANEKGVSINEVLSLLLESLNRSMWIVGHNIDFDLQILSADFYRHLPTKDQRFLHKNKFCTMLNSTNYCNLINSKGLKYPSLSELYLKVFNKSLAGSHNALIDIQATADCFWELKKQGIFKPFTDKNMPLPNN